MSPNGSPWYWFARFLSRGVFRVAGGIRTINLENLPRDEAALVAPNHMSFLDPPLVACGLHRAVRFMAKEELFRGLIGKFIKSVGGFPVRRGEKDVESIKTAIRTLESGRALLVFPEGTRGNGKILGPVTPGIAMFARKTNSLVVPVGIVGTERALPKGAKMWKRQRLTIVVGQPFRYSDVATGANERENRDLFANYLAEKIAEACRQGGLAMEVAPENRPGQLAESSLSGSHSV